MYAPAIVEKTLKNLQDRVSTVTSWGDAQAAKALSLASTLFWAPLTVPYGLYQFSLGLYPVQELLLKPILSLQTSKTVGLALASCNIILLSTRQRHIWGVAFPTVHDIGGADPKHCGK